eukprot:m.1235003 g.1235003  ORF g.1235003 m.1235003 type:complete len:98 (+) comp24665_c0_seq60:2764-3057(+)
MAWDLLDAVAGDIYHHRRRTRREGLHDSHHRRRRQQIVRQIQDTIAGGGEIVEDSFRLYDAIPAHIYLLLIRFRLRRSATQCTMATMNATETARRSV